MLVKAFWLDRLDRNSVRKEKREKNHLRFLNSHTAQFNVDNYNSPNLPATLAEDGLKQPIPSSYTQPFTATAATTQHARKSRLTTLTVPFGNIERHAKTAKTDPETPCRNRNRGQTANRKAELPR